MRYYEIYFPGDPKGDPEITSNARRLKNLPDGTRIYRTITDRDGSLVDQTELIVENGKVVFPSGSAKHIAKITR